MTNVSPLERAEQQVKGFEHTYSIRHGETYARNLFYLACHAALPAAISVDLVHLLRINFFFENTEQLPYTAEADLLLSPLCTEIGDELYEMDHEVRDILLQKLTDKYGTERLKEVAKLLWQYDQRFAPWADREMLERAQQLTALSFVDPAQAREWLAQKSHDDYSLEQKVWFTAVNQEVLLAEKVILPPGERPGVVGVGEAPIAPDGDQTRPAPVEGVEPRVGVSPPDVSHIESSEDKQPAMIGEPEQAYEPSSRQEPPAEPSIDAQAGSKQEDEEPFTIDKERRLPRELRNRLVILLLQVPGLEDAKTRNSLLSGIPNRESIFFHRTESLRADISGFVDRLSMMRLSDGRWALLVFIDNALDRLEGTITGEELKELRRQFEALYKQDDKPIAIFYCYAPEDERYYKELDKHLAVMKRNKLITTYGLDILAGTVTKEETERALQAADIVLLLVSPDMMASDRLYEELVKPALLQRQAGTTYIIPIIVRDTAQWRDSEFGMLQPSLQGRKPVQAWKHPDEALALIAGEIRQVVDGLRSSRSKSSHAK